jgi:hypothetical protein
LLPSHPECDVPLIEAWDDPVTLRNFGLSFSRRSARPNAVFVAPSARGRHWLWAPLLGLAVIVILIVLALLL